MPFDFEALAKDFWNNPDAGKHQKICRACEENPKDARVWVLLFNASCQLGKFSDAEMALERLSAQHPNNALAQTGRAELAFAKQDYGAAFTLFDDLPANVKSQPRIALKWMRVALQHGNPSDVGKVAAFVESLPLSLDKLLAAGAAAMFRKDFLAAEAAYGKVLALRPSHLEALVQLALASEAQGKLEDALSLFAAAQKQVPSARNLKAHELRVQFKFRPELVLKETVEEHVRSSNDSRPALQLALDYARYRNDVRYEDLILRRLGKAWPEKARIERAYRALAQGNLSDAITHLTPVPEDLPLQTRRATLLSNALKSQGDSDGLAELAESLSEPTLHFRLKGIAASIALHLGATDRAAEIARQVRDEAPNDPQYWCLEADAMTRDGRGRDALVSLAGAPDSVQNTRPYLVRSHEAARAIGEFPAATEFLREAVKSGDCRARNRLACFLADLGNFNEAKDCLDGWRSLNRADEDLRCITGAALKQKQYDFKDSIPYLDEVLEENPQNAEALNLRARARLLTFDAAGAMSDLNASNTLMTKNGARPRKPRESILGELANELLLDPELSAKAARASGSKKASDHLLNLWKDDPGNSMVAIGVLLALRNEGKLAAAGQEPAPESPTQISPKIFQYWEGDPPGTDLEAAMGLLKSRNPWAEYRRFDGDTGLAYIRKHAPQSVARAFMLARHPAERADLLRLVVLLQEGGIWVDADDICREDLTAVLPRDARLVLYQEWLGSTGNNFIAAAPGSPVLERTLKSATDELLHGATESIWLRTGPGAVSRAMVDTLAKSEGGCLPAGTHIIAGWQLMKVLAPACPFSYKQTSAHWVVSEQG